LSDAEKQRRRDHNLCIRCGRGGHVMANCTAGRRMDQNAAPQVKAEGLPNQTNAAENDKGSTNQ
jgi:hypothetical protein